MFYNGVKTVDSGLYGVGGGTIRSVHSGVMDSSQETLNGQRTAYFCLIFNLLTLTAIMEL